MKNMAVTFTTYCWQRVRWAGREARPSGERAGGRAGGRENINASFIIVCVQDKTCGGRICSPSCPLQPRAAAHALLPFRPAPPRLAQCLPEEGKENPCEKGIHASFRTLFFCSAIRFVVYVSVYGRNTDILSLIRSIGHVSIRLSIYLCLYLCYQRKCVLRIFLSLYCVAQ